MTDTLTAAQIGAAETTAETLMRGTFYTATETILAALAAQPRTRATVEAAAMTAAALETRLAGDLAAHGHAPRLAGATAARITRRVTRTHGLA